MPDPDDILWEQSEIPEPEAPQLPPENPAPTEDVLGIDDPMTDLGNVARAEVAPPQPEIADADVPAFQRQETADQPPLTPQQRVHQQAWQRGAERKERLGKPVPPPPDWNRIAADNETFADLGQVARAEAMDADGGPVPEGAMPGIGSEFHPESFADQGFGVQQLEKEGQQRDTQRQAFDASIRLNVLLTEMTKEYGRKLDDMATRLERDRL